MRRCSPPCSHYAFVQRGVLEVLLLSVGAGLLGTWIVLRGLAFYSARRRDGRVPRPGARRRPGFPAPAARWPRRAVSPSASAARDDRARSYDSLTGARPRRRARARGHPRERRLPLRLERRDAALRQPARDRPARPRARRAAAPRRSSAPAALLGRRWLAIGFDARGRAALGARSPLPGRGPARLIVAVRRRRCPRSGALLATALFVVPAATVRLWTAAGCPVATRVGGAGRGRGRRGPLALGQDERAARRGDRRARRRRVFALAAGRPRARPRRPAARRRRRRARSLLVAGCGSGGGVAPGVNVVATTTQIGDWVARSAADASRPPDPAAEHRPARVRAAPGRRRSRRPARSSCSRTATTSTRWMGKVVSQAGGSPTVVDLGAAGAGGAAGRDEPGRRRRASTRTGGTTRATPRRRCGRSPARSAQADPRTRRATAARRAAYLAQAASSTGDRRLFRAGAGRAAQARHRPRRVRLLRPPLRDHGRRRGDPVADDAGPAVGRRDRAADRADPARARQGGLPGELAQPAAWRRRSRARPAPRRTRSTATRSARPGSPGATYLGMERGERRRDGARLHRRARGCAIGQGRTERDSCASSGSPPATAAPPSSTGSTSSWTAASGSACSARTAAASRRSSAPCSASSTRSGTVDHRDRCGSSRRPSAPGSTIRSARSTWR